jgi:hypothetical protein
MSDSESIISDVDSFNSIEENIQALSHLITEIYGEAEELEEHLVDIQKPLMGLQMAQLGQLPFLEASPFRHATFKIKDDLNGILGLDTHKRYPFHSICTLIRNHLISSGAVLPNGQIKLNHQLQNLFGIKESIVGYITLIGALRNVLD